jgi:hypothetical protein
MHRSQKYYYAPESIQATLIYVQVGLDSPQENKKQT